MQTEQKNGDYNLSPPKWPHSPGAVWHACGASEETPDHVFWQCPRFTRERRNVTKGLLERWNALPLKMDVILIDTDPSDVNILATFSNAAKIRI
jgi:hypothetical protein